MPAHWAEESACDLLNWKIRFTNTGFEPGNKAHNEQRMKGCVEVSFETTPQPELTQRNSSVQVWRKASGYWGKV